MKRIISIALIAVFILLLSGCTESFKRSFKDTTSGIIGLNRRVTVLSADGEVVKTYEGRIDIEANEYGNKIKFEVEGKRVMIYNMGVIVEEQ